MNANFKLNDIRKAMRKTTGTPSYCVKQLYVISETCKELKIILPAKKDGLAQVKNICEFGNVGGIRVWKGTVKGCETTREITIKCSVDLVLRYFLKKMKGEI